ncbi:MAG: carbohydrate kinase family protein [Chloroflexi bacterium]|nr:carbohydrate kinase family protein [Chloroflexota bacterium]
MVNRNPQHILIFGAATVDIKGRAASRLVPGSSTPGQISLSYGGVARNIAENLARLGEPTILLSAVGRDPFGAQILEHTAQGGVDVSRVLISPNHHSATFLRILDEKGAPLLSLDEMGIIQLLTPDYVAKHRELFDKAKMVVIDANLPPPTIRAIVFAARRANVPLCADPASVALAPKLRRYLANFAIVRPNVHEAEVLTGMSIGGRGEAMQAAQYLVSRGVGIAIITLAEEGLCYATSTESGYIPAIKCEVIDYTGAGDALTAAVVYGLLNEMPIDEAMRLGVSAATLTLKCHDTVCPDLSLERLYDQLVI